MTGARSSTDNCVVIDRVRVRVRPPEGSRPDPTPARFVRPRVEDRRIHVDELCIDADAPLDELDARRLGQRVADSLAERLAALQVQRLGGGVHIRTLRVVLRGADAERPDFQGIAAVLASAVAREVTPC